MPSTLNRADGEVEPIPSNPEAEVSVVVAEPVPIPRLPPYIYRSPAVRRSAADSNRVLIFRLVNVPAAGVVRPIVVLLIVPPVIVRASTTSASCIESFGTLISPVTLRPVTPILVERIAGIDDVAVDKILSLPDDRISPPVIVRPCEEARPAAEIPPLNVDVPVLWISRVEVEIILPPTNKSSEK